MGIRSRSSIVLGSIFLLRFVFLLPVFAQEGARPVRVETVVYKMVTSRWQGVGTVEGANQVGIYPRAGGKFIKYVVEEGAEVKKGDVVALVDRDVVGYKFNPAKVVAPAGGVVMDLTRDQGEVVTSATPVGIVVELDRIKVVVEVPEYALPKVKVGGEAEVRCSAYPGEVFKGKVSKKVGILDPVSRTSRVEVAIDNPQRKLLPGMFARVDLILDRHKALVMPLDALMKFPGSGSYYCLVVEDGKVEKRYLKVGGIGEWGVEVIEGLSEGDLVVVSAQGGVEEGEMVRPVMGRNK